MVMLTNNFKKGCQFLEIYVSFTCSLCRHFSHFILSADNVVSLKVPKCEIFDRSDFDDFYTITSLCEGDFGVKIKKC